MASLNVIWFLLFIDTLRSEIVDCSKSAPNCECYEDETCELQCSGTEACKGLNIFTCRSGYPCTVTCDIDNGERQLWPKSTCESVTIVANGASNLTVQCLGLTACKDTVVRCNGTEVCDIACRSADQYSTTWHDKWHVCGAMELDCDASMCNVECESTGACADINIDTDNAASFECHGECDADTIPAAFTRVATTSNPRGGTSNNLSTTMQPLSTTAQPGVSTSIDTTQPLFTTEMTTQSLSDFYTSSVDTTQSISSTLQTEHTSIEATLTTDGPMQEQEVIEKTTQNEENTAHDDGDEQDTNNTPFHMQILKIAKEMWLYIVIGGSAFCCLCTCGIALIFRRRKQHVANAEPFASKDKPGPKPISITMTPVPSNTATPVTAPSATTTPVLPVTPSKNNKMSLRVIRDSQPQSFSEYLENEALAGSLVMDDVVHNMVTTPGHFDDDHDAYLSPVYLVNEGGLSDAYGNDDQILNDMNTATARATADEDGEEQGEEDESELMTALVNGESDDGMNGDVDEEDDDILTDVNQMTMRGTGENA